MADSGGNWCLIESDPGVFTNLIRTFGATGVQFEEIWSMEDSMFDNMRPVHGVIFLFKYLKNEPPTGRVVTDLDLLERIYFARQVINNACATQAVISILLNCEHPDLRLGPVLTELKNFSRNFDPMMRGLALSNSHTIRAAHNAMAVPHMVIAPETQSTTKEDAYHYVSYLPFDGRLYELDGLRKGPIDHGPIAHYRDWLDVVRPIITARMQRYTAGEIHFSLMALVSDRKLIYERQLSELLTSSRLLGMEDTYIDNEVGRLRTLIDNEVQKRAKYDIESRRRRHNYLPFIINLIQILAKEKKLMPLLEKCKQRAQRSAARRATKRLKT